MAEGRSKAAWAHTSSLLCLLANINRDPKKTQAFKPSDFDPHARKAEQPVQKVTMKELKGMLMGSLKSGRQR